jgi:2-amino-4-hydroxy-6-hydroxymethyldihydropteridine diphosphokinase
MAGAAYIGAGANIDPLKNLVAGLKRIIEDERVAFVALSSFYKTSPVSPVCQEDFLNCALKIAWRDSPHELLSFLQEVEIKQARTRSVKLGPRTLDLDILLFGELVMDTPDLTIPHPRLHERKFAIVPCMEIDPGIVHPRAGRPLADFLADMGPEQKIEPFRKVSLEEIEAAEDRREFLR